jgi:hypothetical protein
MQGTGFSGPYFFNHPVANVENLNLLIFITILAKSSHFGGEEQVSRRLEYTV